MSRKITFILNEFPALSETFILNQIVYCVENGFEVCIVSRSVGDLKKVHPQVNKYSLLDKTIFIPPVPKNIIERFIKIIRSYLDNYSVKYIFESLKFFNIIKYGIHALSLYIPYNYIYLNKIQNSSIIHAHFGHSGRFICLYKKSKIFKDIPVIVSFHGVDIIPKFISLYKKNYSNIFKHSSELLVNNNYSKELLLKINSKIEDKISILPVGVDTELFQKPELISKKDSVINIVFCSRLISLKGPLNALKIFKNTISKSSISLKLTIIGAGPELQILEDYVFSNNLNDKVHFTGGLVQNDIKHYFSIGDIFIYTGIPDPINGREEIQGLVIQEAQSMEMPVVCSNVGGVKYGIINGGTGYLVPSGNIETFSDRLLTLINNNNLRLEFGKRSREFIINNFEQSVLNKKLINIYFKYM
ncbi:glycosyltransferase [Cyclobacterium sp. 1_MG-2023]|uniref:glycosyltransferase n=1 Tax=Cyclobacterium sp. 1_MG-2023 TaxID=3062681 RepID=UPI0026E3D995|nr:glycosyltransferase [Cyclobacterium sp. 1_MG-2023]MDO6439161.1 glycosyltransferase [Cyclobacterium sp. 1_MG-2023]